MTSTEKEEEEEEQKNDIDDIDDDDDGSICYGVLPEPEFFDYCSLTFEELQMMCQATSSLPPAAASSPGGGGSITTRARLTRRQQQRAKFVPLSQISSRDVLRIEPMAWWNEGLCICFLSFVVPLGKFDDDLFLRFYSILVFSVIVHLTYICCVDFVFFL